MDRHVHGSPNGHRKSHDHNRGKHRHSEERKSHHHRTGSSHTNGLPPPKNEVEQRIRRLFDPISNTLVKVSGATKKKIPEDDVRLKLIKHGLMTIGNHINLQVRDKNLTTLEEKLWEYVSDNYWPQSKQQDKRVPGHKLRDMFKKLAGKESAAGKTSGSKSKPAGDGSTSTPHVNGTTSNVKKESSPSVEKKVPVIKRESSTDAKKPSSSSPTSVKDSSKMDVDSPAERKSESVARVVKTEH
jgi:chromodomain-helicase-DNA-binding protein 1